MSLPSFRTLARGFALVLAVAALVGYALLRQHQAALDAELQETLALLQGPEGSRLSVFAQAHGARSLAASEDGRVVFIGTNQPGLVHAAVDADRDGAAEEVRIFLRDLNTPNGVALRGGDLYVGLQDRVVLLRGAVQAALDGDAAPGMETVLTGFHDDWHHGWRYMRFGPDGRLYVTLGAPCNICALTPNTGKIIAADVAAGPLPEAGWEVIADGLRNSVGLDWDGTGRLWFTDNGADHMGDEIPADELNRMPDRAAQSGAPAHFGFPWRGGRDVALTDADRRPAPPEGMIPAAAELTAHSASLGLEFLGGAAPDALQGHAAIAQHGSWNRSEVVGHRVVLARIEGGEVTGVEPFVTGWLQEDEEVFGRPVDVLQMPDGSLLISDDWAGAVWRLAWD